MKKAEGYPVLSACLYFFSRPSDVTEPLWIITLARFWKSLLVADSRFVFSSLMRFDT